MTLDEAREHIGHGVVYQPHPAAEREDGTIAEVRGSYVFVQYVGDRAPKATRAEDIDRYACAHEWLDRPESDSRECLVCGEEVFGG